MLSTPVNIPATSKQWVHGEKLILIGSCFAETIGNRLLRRKFDVLVNPLGIVFNPISLAALLNRAIDERPFPSDSFFEHQELWRHFDVHSNFAELQRNEAVENANQRLATLSDALKSAKHLVLTFGTAIAYRDKSSGSIVGHNHKLPAEAFERARLSVTEIVDAFIPVLDSLSKSKGRPSVVLTVSPVKHLKEGLHDNNLSKATLLLAADELRQRYANIEYFPSYELMTDELRDYRFYESDMAHPNRVATDFIWEKLEKTKCPKETRKLSKAIVNLYASLDHRPRHPRTRAYSRHLDDLEKAIRDLEKMGFDFTRERVSLQKQRILANG